MTVVPLAGGGAVRLDDLRVGDLLAEGGEGRVFELPLQPHLVFKAYRHEARREFLDDLVRWPGDGPDAERVGRVRAATAWPTAVVVDSARLGPARLDSPRRDGDAAGVLLPRAPRRFAVRHRDGSTHLATLSYLTADPAYRAVAYGLSLPPPVSVERLGIVYALARLLETFERSVPGIGHGDLSTKNVLWSLQRGPEVFVLDCDNCERYGPGGRPLGTAGRRRAMTPNWEDPAVGSGDNPSPASDRYSLALIFLRVVGAANFPIQARQRQGEDVTVDFAMPAGSLGEVLLGPGAALWDLCSRGLAVTDPSGRPPAAAWVAALEAVLDGLGAAAVMRKVWAAQGGGASDWVAPAGVPEVPNRAGAARADRENRVLIRPVLATPRAVPRWTVVAPERVASLRRWPIGPGLPGAPAGMGTAAGGLLAGAASPGLGPAGPAGAAGGPGANLPTGAAGFVSTPASAPAGIAPQLAAHARRVARWWLDTHREMIGLLWRAGHRRNGVRRLAWCALVDVVGALVGLFVVAMIVAPVLGI